MAKPKLIPKIDSLADLLVKASVDPRYAQLALLAASNLGGRVRVEDVDDLAAVARAINWLRLNAAETTAAGVVAEVNFVRDCVTETRTVSGTDKEAHSG